MRILHTSDWHLNDRLGRISRQDDIVKRLEEIANYLDEHKVDVMIVAGDLFSQYNRLDELKSAVGKMRDIFQPFLLGGGTIITISGNHDNEAFFDLMHSALDLADPIDLNKSGARPTGRLYLAAQPTYLLLQDKAGQQVQFILMPYPTSSRYLKDQKTKYGSLDEKNRLLHESMLQKIDRIKNKFINPQLPSVLVGHAHIRGSQLHNLYRISEREDVVFDAGDIPTNWAYAAYGHIHKPQALAGTIHVRYSGSIERLDYGERDDEKSVVLVEIGAKGRTQEPVCLSLNATPIYRVEINNPEEIASLKDKYSELDRALVDYELTYKPGEHNRDAICRELDKIFPRWYNREIMTDGSSISLKSSTLVANTQDVETTVRTYLEQQLAGNKDKDAVLKLAEQLLADETFNNSEVEI
ncbi:metallophosphoesterase family protein [Calothrix sp. CCY 0018]|uniref:metallophosphoesterase family protein n=1 Tax=Calothrix sp. CCY 0018 TaxID=3103864 RepID=UPI0039C6DA55